MKQFITVTICVFTCGIFVSCSKSSGPPTTVAAVNIANANIGSQGIMPNFWGTGFSYENNGLTIGYGSASEFSIAVDNSTLTIAQSVDTSQPFFSGSFNFKVGGIYTLFVAGSTTSADTLLAQDVIPYLPATDSSTGLRFVNLVQGQDPISIDIQGNSENVVNSLVYKGMTGFQVFSSNTAAQAVGYIFEFRDVVSDSLLTTYQLTITPNKCQTLIFSGSAASGYLAFAENNF